MSFCSWWRGRTAVKLNLRADTFMAAIGDRINFTITPKNAAGNPAPVTQIMWTVSVGSLTVAPDNMSASYVASGAGDIAVVVMAKSASGKDLRGAVTVLVDGPAIPPPDNEAVTLNLAIAP